MIDNLDDETVLQLANHIRCSSHTLSLVATTDAKKAIDASPSLARKHKNIVQRSNTFWKMVGKSKQKEKLLSILGKALSRPVPVRWNSFYDSWKEMFKLKEKVLKAIADLKNGHSLREADFDYIEEYVKCMRLIAHAIEMLQGEKNCFYGILLPTLLGVRKQLLSLENEELRFCLPIVTATIRNLNSRFSQHFNIEKEGTNAAVAALTHPAFKGRWMTCLSIELQNKVKSVIIKAAKQLENEVVNPAPPETTKNPFESDLFDFGEEADCFQDESPVLANVSSELEVLYYLKEKCTTDYSVLDKFPIVRKLFFRYNTPLPSSAPVERFFCYATMYDIPRFNRMTDDLFEKRILLTANKIRI